MIFKYFAARKFSGVWRALFYHSCLFQFWDDREDNWQIWDSDGDEAHGVRDNQAVNLE